MKSITVKELFDLISEQAYKKDIVNKSKVSNDRMTRLLDPLNGGKVADLAAVLKSYGWELTASKDGKVIPIKVGG